jgi:hypothetical protein
VRLYMKRIKVDRQSVCMGDDVAAPNEDIIEVSEQDRLINVVEKVAQYLPRRANAVWAIDSGTEVVAYIIMDKKGEPTQYDLCKENRIFFKMKIRALHCSYFYSMQENSILLEKAKNCMKERFVQTLQISSGSLCIWGEWFGKPYDKFHIVDTVRWGIDEIRIHFQEEEALFIHNPVRIVNEESRLLIGDATEILWVWYDYGKVHNYENMYIRQYIKRGDGTIFRTEGRRRDVRIGEGILFHPIENIAIYIG